MISFEWNSANFAPADWYAPILYISGNNKIGVLKDTVSWLGGEWKDKSKHYSDWEWLKDKYNIKFWVYQSQLLQNE